MKKPVSFPPHRTGALFFRLLFLLLVLRSRAGGQPFPAVEPIDVPPAFGEALGRTAGLLNAQETAPSPAVRVLVYGQSISMQNWWLAVKRYLQERYPQKRIIMENRAIGGFSAERLRLMVDNDVVPFYPDLILFHDYGNEPDYEAIIRTLRSRTTADIAIQTDHLGIGQNQEWHDRHCSVWLPALCRTYGLGLLDVRSAWKAYLNRHQLEAKALLSDNVHLNEHGNFVMAEIIRHYLESLNGRTPAPSPAVRTLLPGREVAVRKDRVQISFTGNRIDLEMNPAGPATITARLDGADLTVHPAGYFHTRPALRPDGFFLTHIGLPLTLRLGGQPREEDWTMTITSVDSVRQQLRFRVSGSLTGEDGEGSSEGRFVSRSGRIGLDSAGWFRRKNPGDFRQFAWLKPGDRLHWRVFPAFQTPGSAPADASVTVVLGVENRAHRLELRGPGARHIRAIRVFRPPLQP
ncbi:SGNH/GDSL hydrolase family protein [Larkinella soli]|uniref:SGNH/GDSL hydrolase family protein n=1 Tax=Larkinella soli TaxID=1770527 RepID=UPI000FFB4B14|nr:hypothetical protein [Larkinella soli]